jgi:hypothetical protein
MSLLQNAHTVTKEERKSGGKIKTHDCYFCQTIQHIRRGLGRGVAWGSQAQTIRCSRVIMHVLYRAEVHLCHVPKR